MNIDQNLYKWKISLIIYFDSERQIFILLI